MFLYILENIPRWNSHFEVNEIAKKICNRCQMVTEYPVERSYGLIITANSIRETKASSFLYLMILSSMNVRLETFFWLSITG